MLDNKTTNFSIAMLGMFTVACEEGGIDEQNPTNLPILIILKMRIRLSFLKINKKGSYSDLFSNI